MAQSSATSLVTLRPTINQLTKHGHGMIKPLSSCSSFAFHADDQSLAFPMRSDWEWSKISSAKARRVERRMGEDNRDHSRPGVQNRMRLKPVICKPAKPGHDGALSVGVIGCPEVAKLRSQSSLPAICILCQGGHRGQAAGRRQPNRCREALF